MIDYPRGVRTGYPILASTILVVTAFAACGGSKKPAATSPSSSSAEPASSEAPAASVSTPAPAASQAPAGLPTACASSDGGVCAIDSGFVKRLCDGSFPDTALALFASSAPFTRIYVRGDMDGWNADGGKSARARLRFEEEVLVLKRRAVPKGGVQVGSGGGYLVMRWDGNCYTLEDGEVTTKRPPSPKHAPLAFHLYDEAIKNALLKSPKVLAAYQKRGKECKGAMSGDVTKTCEQADAALADAVVDEIRKGASIPTPAKLP